MTAKQGIIELFAPVIDNKNDGEISVQYALTT